jgi:hypothetical protein
MTAPRTLAVLVLLPLLAAAPRGRYADPDALLRAGNQAYQAGDLGRAAELYERAGVRTTQPSRAAFNLATARYRQARADNAQALAEAEEAYRSCLERGDPYRAPALFGLGNCLLLRAAGGTTLDRATLRAAIDRFSLCLAEPGCPPGLADDARYNCARARLLLLQAPPPPGANEEGAPGDDDKPDDPPDSSQGPDGSRDPGKADRVQQSQGNPAGGGNERPGETKDKVDGPNGAGRGTILPPPQDTSETKPLSERDAVQHLEEATKRILEDVAAYRRGRPRPLPPGVRDW